MSSGASSSQPHAAEKEGRGSCIWMTARCGVAKDQCRGLMHITSQSKFSQLIRSLEGSLPGWTVRSDASETSAAAAARLLNISLDSFCQAARAAKRTLRHWVAVKIPKTCFLQFGLNGQLLVFYI